MYRQASPFPIRYLQAVRTLGAGRQLTGQLLAPAPLVRRGQIVELRITRPRFTIRTEGKALRDGLHGERIPVKLNTGIGVEGTVQADGTLLVVRGGS